VIRPLARDDRGLAAIEMAFALPILLTFVYGIFQVGMIMAASAGMQHALGEGARYATLYPTPTDIQIRQRVQDKLFGDYICGGTCFSVDPVATDSTGKSFKTLSVHYTVTPNFLFFTAPSVTLDRSKKIYLSF
jgi:Flp pilus assembly protein TadG